MTEHKRACGNPTCCTSTGIHGGLTFGHGRLDEHGFWEFPCRPCAAAFDERKPQVRAEIEAEGHDLEEHEWLFIPAWPRADQDCATLTRDIQAQLAEDDVKWAEFESAWPEIFAHDDNESGEFDFGLQLDAIGDPA